MTNNAERTEAHGRMARVKVGEITGPADFWYAGKGSRKNPMAFPLRVRQENGASNVIRIVQVDTGQVITSVRASSVIWTAPLAQDQDAPQAQTPAPRKRKARKAADVAQVEPAKLPGKPPRNWVELARTGNTPQARVYWTRACRRYAGCTL